MNGSEKLNALLKIMRNCLSGIAIMLLCWLACALSGNLYATRPHPIRLAPAETAVHPSAPHDLNECLSVLQQREFFKQSIIYDTKPKEVVNILGDLTFLGVVQDGSNLKAFIMNKKEGTSTLVAKGDSLGDLTIENIFSDHIELKHGAESLQLVR